MRKTTLACDVCGEPAQSTEKFHVLGKAGRVDLCDEHDSQYRNLMETWLQAASGRSRTQDDRQNSAEIRTWAMGEGLELSSRGRIPDEIVRKYEAAHSS